MTRDLEGIGRDLLRRLDDRLADADEALASGYPGRRSGRQPVHTVYVPADRYVADLAASYGVLALGAVAEHRADFEALVGDDDVVERVLAKLASEPVEDLRIDFEDGYVGHSAAEEQADASRTAHAWAAARDAGVAPPFGGIRIKCLEPATRARSVDTLLTFVGTLVDRGGHSGGLDGWVVTLPKVTSVDQVAAMVEICEVVEDAVGIAPDTLRFEVQVETPQSILGADGTALVARMIHVADRRLSALHYGTYDYSAFCGIAAGQQALDHPVADHAKLVMQAAAAGTGVWLSDGSTNILPVGGRDDVLAAWANHHRLVRRSLERGYYQGWDLHPAQLPTRFAATYAFYRDGLPRALQRLDDYTRRAATGVADEPATARALADFVLRGLECGAVDVDEVRTACSLDRAALHSLADPSPISSPKSSPDRSQTP